MTFRNVFHIASVATNGRNINGQNKRIQNLKLNPIRDDAYLLVFALDSLVIDFARKITQVSSHLYVHRIHSIVISINEIYVWHGAIQYWTYKQNAPHQWTVRLICSTLEFELSLCVRAHLLNRLEHVESMKREQKKKSFSLTPIYNFQEIECH